MSGGQRTSHSSPSESAQLLGEGGLGLIGGARLDSVISRV